MGLFQNRPQVSNPVNYITVGLNKTVLLVGLGNIGKEYDDTRHNIGFAAIDSFVATHNEMSAWINKKDLKCHFSSGQLGQTRVIAIKPTTFMNLSGEAVLATMQFYKVQLEHVVIVHDELDINFGHIRTRVGGSSAGHNGIKSITKLAGEETGRVRIGIGPKKPAQIDSSDFVLAQFTKKEEVELGNLNREVTAILSEYVFGGKLLTETRSFTI
jgi:PTH1 family peptidyl-tRNA hydrolase